MLLLRVRLSDVMVSVSEVRLELLCISLTVLPVGYSVIGASMEIMYTTVCVAVLPV
jgi:hypothetical protein